MYRKTTFFFSDCFAADKITGTVNVAKDGTTTFKVFSGSLFITNKKTNSTSEIRQNSSLTLKPDGKELKNNIDSEKELALFENDSKYNSDGLTENGSPGRFYIFLTAGFIFIVIAASIIALIIIVSKKKRLPLDSKTFINQPLTKFCGKCGTKIISEANFCPKCGNKL